MADVRVLIVSPNPLARGGMAAMIEPVGGIRAVGSAGLAEAASLSGQLLPDAILLDVGQGEPEDLDAIARLASAQPGLPIVAMGGTSASIGAALAFGASALLPGPAEQEIVRIAILAAVGGLVTILRSELSAVLPGEGRFEHLPRSDAESLTSRELEVLQLMARGLTNRQIGRQLHISEHTVKFHAGSVLGKLGAHSRAEAVARAIGQGWILV